jgi:hypothetical protein
MMVGYKSKSDVRAESDVLLADFLRSGGTITIGTVKKTPRVKVSCKTSRGFVTGSSGFAVGFRNRSL